MKVGKNNVRIKLFIGVFFSRSSNITKNENSYQIVLINIFKNVAIAT